MEEKLKAFERLLNIMDDLREKCPWDKKQTNETLRPLSIEEVYELGDAILKKDDSGIKEELGDLFLHLVFYAKIGEEQDKFNVADVLNSVCEKLIHRHPHIYGNTVAETEDEVLKNWEKLKLKEGKKSILQGVPESMPALIKAYRLQQKTAKVGFEWENTEQVWEKVKEEEQELKEALSANNQDEIEDEFGDLMFALVNYARFIKVDPEAALEKTNIKFKNRFEYIEKQAQTKNLKLEEMTLAEMDALWNEAKRQN
ncbi:MAG: nucleoside triphosphate pyrophosphohydrolase [Chitinophagales bacterium]|nr:nucleoside triphosphate pyrophosphohydrolase [Bacteroidota bacterium]